MLVTLESQQTAVILCLHRTAEHFLVDSFVCVTNEEKFYILPPFVLSGSLRHAML